MNKAKARTTAQVLRNAARIMEQGEHVTPGNASLRPMYPCWMIADAKGEDVDTWHEHEEVRAFLAVMSEKEDVFDCSEDYLDQMYTPESDMFGLDNDETILALCLAAAVIKSGGL